MKALDELGGLAHLVCDGRINQRADRQEANGHLATLLNDWGALDEAIHDLNEVTQPTSCILLPYPQASPATPKGGDR